MNFMRTLYKIHVSETDSAEQRKLVENQRGEHGNGKNLFSSKKTVKPFFIRGASLISSIHHQLLYSLPFCR